VSDPGREKGKSRILRWLEDVTDARILTIPRLFGLLYGPIEDRLPLREAWRASMQRRLPRHVGWKHAFGGATYFLAMILVATGVMLSFYYRPSTVEAYPSLQYLETEITFGWLVRHVHFWAASLVVLACLLHLFRVLFSGTYRLPRQTTWIIGIFLLVTLLAFVTSGYLLPWDQWAYWTTSNGLDQLERLPLIGGFLTQMFRVDEFVSGATLSRFYATHVILLPWILLLFLSLHFQLVRKHGVAPAESGEVEEGEPFFPNHMLRQLVVAFVTLGLVLTLAAFYPRPFGPAADPFVRPEEIPALGFPAAILVGAGRLPLRIGLVGLPVLLVALAILPLAPGENSRSFLRRPLALVVFVLFLMLLGASLLMGVTTGPGANPGGG